MPRRVGDYVPVEPLIIMNQISTVGAYVMLASMGIFLVNLIRSAGWGKPAKMEDHSKLERNIMTTGDVSLITSKGRATDMSSDDSHGHDKEPIILTSPRRFGKGIVIVVVTMAIGRNYDSLI